MGLCFIVLKQRVVDWVGWLIEHRLHCRSRLCPLFNGKSLEECSFALIWKSSACFYRNIVECQYSVSFGLNELVVSEGFTSSMLCCCFWWHPVYYFFLSYCLWLTLSHKPSCHSHELGLERKSLLYYELSRILRTGYWYSFPNLQALDSNDYQNWFTFDSSDTFHLYERNSLSYCYKLYRHPF